MGEKITFRPRGRGCCVGSGVSASITEPRVRFIKGWLTGGTNPADGSMECGDGTSFPMEVTIDQLSEIMYRVRDAEYTQGELVTDYDSDTYTTSIINSPATLLAETDSGAFDSCSHSFRGYLTCGDVTATTDDPPMNHVAGSSILGTPYEVGESYDGATGNGKMKVREAESELAMWQNSNPTGFNPEQNIGKFEQSSLRLLAEYQLGLIGGSSVGSSWVYPDTFRTGFSMEAASAFDDDTTIYAPETANPSGALATASGLNLTFGGAVAWIDNTTTPTGSPFGAGSRIFIGVDFNVEMQTDSSGMGLLSTLKPYLAELYDPTEIDTGSELKLRLADAGGSPVYVTAPLYSFTEDFDDIGNVEGYVSSTDWIFTANKWWPYAHANGSPSWNTTTGAYVVST